MFCIWANDKNKKIDLRMTQLHSNWRFHFSCHHLFKNMKKRIRATSCRIQPQICLKYTSVPTESRGAQKIKGILPKMVLLMVCTAYCQNMRVTGTCLETKFTCLLFWSRITCSWHVFTNSESTDFLHNFFHNFFFLFSYKTRWNSSIEIKKMCQ